MGNSSTNKQETKTNMSDINWSEVLDDIAQDPGLKPLEPGNYTVIVEKAEAVRAQSSNAPMIKVQARVKGGSADGKVLFTNLVFSTGNPKAMNFTLRKLDGLGLSTETITANNMSTAAIASAIIGAVADVEVTQKEYNDTTQNEIKSFKRPAGSVPGAPSVQPGPKPGVPTVPAAPKVPAPPVVEEAAPAPEAEADNEEAPPF